MQNLYILLQLETPKIYPRLIFLRPMCKKYFLDWFLLQLTSQTF